MDHLTPPLLSALREVRWHIEAGRSTREAVREYLAEGQGDLARQIREFLILHEQKKGGTLSRTWKNPYQAAFWDLLVRGFEGHPVRDALAALESEVGRAADADIDRHVALLPFRALLPLLLCQFPAFVTVLILPLLRDLPQ